jgi:tRNA pseudouridine55 synthase
MPEMDGVLVVDKPEGPTSHDVVAWARRVLGTRAIGHTGTLDPMATGVLVLVVGRATRLAQFYASHRKSYEATLRLGVVTDTWDRTGATLSAQGGPFPGPADIGARLQEFLGAHAQVPPPYSAKKVDGVRAHELARKGRDVVVAAASVELHSCRVVSVELPIVRLSLVTSAGYYVRSLVHELGQAIGCGACLEQLRRTASGAFVVDQAVGPAWLDAHPAEAAARIVGLEALLPDFPAVVLDEADARRAGHGNEVRVAADAAAASASAVGGVRLFSPDGRLLAIARPTGRPGILHPAVVLR